MIKCGFKILILEGKTQIDGNFGKYVHGLLRRHYARDGARFSLVYTVTDHESPFTPSFTPKMGNLQNAGGTCPY